MLKKFFNNTRKPEGILGKIMVNMMNSGHKSVAKWGHSFIDVKENDTILDIGCGGGHNIKTFLNRASQTKVYGIDYSNISVEKSRKLNKGEIENGRCFIYQSSVENLPFKDATFDIISAFETVYFWPNIVDSFKEVNRVLKHGATFAITNEAYDHRADKWANIIDGMKVYNGDELKILLKKAGFVDVKINLNEKKGWMSIIATKEDRATL